jgi:L-lysine exporter family protein LysE/ArgO
MPAAPAPFDAALAGAWLQGLTLMAGLILAIGAQNLLVLRQGASGQPVGPVVAVCTLSDWLLSAAGVFGLGALVSAQPRLLELLRWGGAAFLFVYGLQAARRAWLGGAALAGSQTALPWRGAVATAMAVTWLNPHVYLDTVLLLGSVASSHGDAGRWLFGVGAVVASFVWFAALGYGARLLSGFFARPRSWRILDGFVAAVMIALGLQLVLTS